MVKETGEEGVVVGPDRADGFIYFQKDGSPLSSLLQPDEVEPIQYVLTSITSAPSLSDSDKAFIDVALIAVVNGMLNTNCWNLNAAAENVREMFAQRQQLFTELENQKSC